jgi:D-arabinitol 4-dehydrogenase
MRRWHDGKLPFAYEDQSMDPVRAHALFTTADPLAAFCRDPILWGPLAGSPGLETGIRHALTEVDAFLREHAPAGA